MTDSHFQYTLRIREPATEFPALRAVFPSVEAVRVKSRGFERFDDAVDSCNRLVTDLAAALNATTGEAAPFYLASEINPRVRQAGEAPPDLSLLEAADKEGDPAFDEDEREPEEGEDRGALAPPEDDDEWEPNEIARLWLLDRRDERSPVAGATLYERYGSAA